VLVGMFFRYYFDRPENQKFWNWREITRPSAISPLIFFPLAGILEIATAAPERVLQLLAPAFIFWENGFSWEKIFEERLKQKVSQLNKTPVNN
jgi:hypothetical protein